MVRMSISSVALTPAPAILAMPCAVTRLMRKLGQGSGWDDHCGGSGGAGDAWTFATGHRRGGGGMTRMYNSSVA